MLPDGPLVVTPAAVILPVMAALPAAKLPVYVGKNALTLALE